MKKLLLPMTFIAITTALFLLNLELNKDKHNVSNPSKKILTASDIIERIERRSRNQKIDVTVRKLMSDYVTNPYNADKIYTVNQLIVTGAIRSISREETKDFINQFEYLIRLDGGVADDSQTEVFCKFDRSQSDSLKYLKKEDTVKIMGYILTDMHYDIDGKKKRGGLRRYVREHEGIPKRGYLKSIRENPEAPKKKYVPWAERTIYYVVMDQCKLITY